MAAAVVGVAFANVLVMMQLGILGAIGGTVDRSYAPVRADILVSASDASMLSDGSPVARALMYRALAVPGVSGAAPLYVGRADWTRPDGTTAVLQVYGLLPEAAGFAGPAAAAGLPLLTRADTVLLDRRIRSVRPGSLPAFDARAPLEFELQGLRLSAVGSFEVGGGITADGALIASDQTFLRLFPRRIAGAPSHLLIDIAPSADPAAVAAQVAAVLGPGLQVRPMAEAMAADRHYQITQRPVGVVFGFGVFIGLLVGLVIVYQVLSTDVADHLREYATFKAMGYPPRFFLSVIFEEALVLAVAGFVPGMALATLLYQILERASGLPVVMTPERPVLVFLGTVLACTISGALATRRLAAADPADLY